MITQILRVRVAVLVGFIFIGDILHYRLQLAVHRCRLFFTLTLLIVGLGVVDSEELLF